MSNSSSAWSVDPVSQLVGPWGLGRVSPEVATRQYRSASERVVLADDVPQAFREELDRLRTMYANSAHDYQLLTVVHDRAHLLLEPLLRLRFLEHYRGLLTVSDEKGVSRSVRVHRFDDVHALARKFNGQRLPLVGHRPFRIGVRGLMGWARTEGYLDGQRNRVVEHAMVKLRHHAAHPTMGTRLMPRDASIALGDLGEVANRLWGHPTPGGRLYPGALRREPVALGVGPAGKILHPPRCLTPIDQEPGWTWHILLAAPTDDPWEFRLGAEQTTYPTDYIAGPVGPAEVAAALAAVADCADEVDYHDRIFWIRRYGGQADAARTAEQMIAFREPALRGEQWIPVLADRPADALAHCALYVAAHEHRPGRGWCLGCGVDQLGDPMTRDTARAVASGRRLGAVLVPRPRRLAVSSEDLPGQNSAPYRSHRSGG